MFMHNLVLDYTLLQNTELQWKWIRCHLKENKIEMISRIR